jgi:hypothetical protein
MMLARLSSSVDMWQICGVLASVTPASVTPHYRSQKEQFNGRERTERKEEQEDGQAGA